MTTPMTSFTRLVRTLAIALFVALIGFPAAQGLAPFAQMPQAQADELESAFNRLSGATGSFTNSDSTSFRTATRHGFQGGGASLRFQHKNYSLVNVQAPGIEVGCNGIDYHLGGFSYIDGEKIQEMLQNIAQGAVAMAFQMALRQLHPLLASTLEFAQSMAQQANKMAIDSCQAAESLMNGFQDEADAVQDAWCGAVLQTPQSGDQDSWLGAQSDRCQGREGREKAVEELEDEGNACDLVQASDMRGNQPWIMLQSIGLAPPPGADDHPEEFYRLAEILMSWMGGTIKHEDADKEDINLSPKITQPEVVVDLFMCGSDHNVYAGTGDLHKVNDYISEYCGERVDTTQEIYVCKDPFDGCMEVETTTPSDLSYFGRGFLPIVTEELIKAVENVRQGREMSARQKAIIGAAPFPLYQAINIASIYPETARSMVVGNAMPLAHMIAMSYFRHMLQNASNESSMGERCVPDSLFTSMIQRQGEMKDQMLEINEMESYYAQVRQRIMTQVQRLNRGILTEMHALGVTGGGFASELSAIEQGEN